MAFAIFGLALLTLIDVVLLMTGKIPASFVLLMLGLTVLGWIGTAMLVLGRHKMGAYLMFPTVLLHIPIGLIAGFGAKKLLDEINYAEFQASRRSPPG